MNSLRARLIFKVSFMTLTYKKHAPPLLENYAKVFEIQC